MKKRYREKGLSSQAVERVRALRSELEALPFVEMPSEPVPLLEMPFIEWCKSLRIKTPEGLQPFELFEWQEETSELFTGEHAVKGRQIIVLSSRQTGKTSLFLALGSYFSLSREQFTGFFIHKTLKDSGQLARRVKAFISDVKLKSDSLSLLEFPTDSQLQFRSSNPTRGQEGAESCGRGAPSVDLYCVEEAAFTQNLKAVIGVIGPAMTWGNPKLSVLISTAGSKQSHYYRLLAASAGGEEKLEALLEGIRQGTEKPFQILNREGPGPIGVISNWRCVPEFAAEKAFLERIQAELNLSNEQIASEFEMISSSSVDAAAFNYGLVMAAQDETLGHYEHKPGDVLFFGLDCCGIGRDFACCLVLSIEDDETGQEIYTVRKMYRKRTGTAEQHLSAIDQMILDLKPIGATVEKNSMGQVWLENLAGRGHSCHIEGFSTSQTSKQVLIGRLQIALEKGVLRIPKGVIIDELLAYRRTDSGKLEAGGNAHDDTVIALALALHSAGFNR